MRAASLFAFAVVCVTSAACAQEGLSLEQVKQLATNSNLSTDQQAALRKALTSGSELDRVSVAVELAKHGRLLSDALPVLLSSATSEDPAMRARLSSTMKILEAPHAGMLSKVTDVFRQPGLSNEEYARTASPLRGKKLDLLPALVKAASASLYTESRNGTKTEVREGNRSGYQTTLAQAAADIGPEALPSLIVLLKSPEPTVSAMAAEAFLLLGEKAALAVAALSEAIHSRDKHTRLFSARALAKLAGRDPTAVPLLAWAADHKDDNVRLTVIKELGTLAKNDPSVITNLDVALGDPNAVIRLAAAEGLATIQAHKKRAVAAIKLERNARELEVRLQVLNTLVRIVGKEEAITTLALRDLGMRQHALALLRGETPAAPSVAPPMPTTPLQIPKPIDVQAVFERAQDLWKQGDRDGAAESFSKIIDAKDKKFAAELAEFLLPNHRLDQARKLLLKSLPLLDKAQQRLICKSIMLSAPRLADVATVIQYSDPQELRLTSP